MQYIQLAMDEVRNMTMSVCVSVIVGVFVCEMYMHAFFVGVLVGAHAQQDMQPNQALQISPVYIWCVISVPI